MNKQKPTIRALDKDHCVATWDRLLIQVWRFGTSPHAVANLNRVARKFMSEEKSPICSLAIVEPTSPPPVDTARAELSAFYREFAPQMKAALVVAEGGGFRAALIRGVGITLSTLAPRTLPFQFVTSVKEATILTAPHMSSKAGGAAGVQSALDELRSEIAAHPIAQSR